MTSTITTFPYKNTPRAFKTRTNQTQRLRVSCNLAPEDQDRGDNTLINCCPPKLQKTIKPFVFPTENTVRMRWSAHKGTPEQMKKFKTAIQAMKDLPHDHPHSFASQAKIHCAYCNGAYTEVNSGFPDTRIEIHNSWLFFPFHRWYLYFFERILGKLINDPTFALPFWQWDETDGMQMPQMFVPENIDVNKNFLYDPFRDNKHLPPAIVDLDYADNDKPHNDQVQRNKCTMYRDLISNAGDPISFFGAIYEAGEEPIPDDKSIGSVETGCHNNVHRWVGDPNQPLHEDMGVFYSAARDPLFYAHHANIDRMWKLWKELRLPGHVDLTHPSWLNASYVFYDENEDLVMAMLMMLMLVVPYGQMARGYGQQVLVVFASLAVTYGLKPWVTTSRH
ncbi:hypothetical protein M8C21_014171 [Ambrosia artemisiifolia]|uniref:Tyrosinase copper-binding domain-containing protein n=1 Tax=Ambrosia artemisiifolia TaxID=4212 RepID=A0AAD5DD46_AMBAR|nr:hypothetical protein M8C21_014171 [Ambrosia artemisiifolia]